jgi:ribosomal protein S18 acetylase RimI-like enzyme
MIHVISDDRPPKALILRHFNDCSSGFVSSIEQKSNLQAYVAKLHSRAKFVSAWESDRIIGLVAFYLNYPAKQAFISNFSVVSGMEGRGIGGLLMAELHLAISKRKDLITMIELNVSSENARAIAFYQKHNFTVVDSLAVDAQLSILTMAKGNN